MFGLFRKKKFKDLTISEAIDDCRRRGITNLTMNVSYEGKILFQVVAARYFYKYALIDDKDKDFAIIHFFYNEKPWANGVWDKFKKNHEEMGYFHFEAPVGVFNFIKNINSSSEVLEHEILNSIDIYDVGDKSRIQIDYLEIS